MMSATIGKGRFGEQCASDFLTDNGYRIVGRNFRSFFGEIDIVAVKNGVICFCEVKTRWNTKYGYPQEAVTNQKLLRIKKTVDYYMKINNVKTQKVKLLVVSQIIINHEPVYRKIIEVE